MNLLVRNQSPSSTSRRTNRRKIARRRIEVALRHGMRSVLPIGSSTSIFCSITTRYAKPAAGLERALGHRASSSWARRIELKLAALDGTLPALLERYRTHPLIRFGRRGLFSRPRPFCASMTIAGSRAHHSRILLSARTRFAASRVRELPGTRRRLPRIRRHRPRHSAAAAHESRLGRRVRYFRAGGSAADGTRQDSGSHSIPARPGEGRAMG